MKIWQLPKGAKRPALSVIDRNLYIDLEVEKMLLFVHKVLGHDITYLNKLSVVTFFQLLREADKVHRAQEKSK